MKSVIVLALGLVSVCGCTASDGENSTDPSSRPEETNNLSQAACTLPYAYYYHNTGVPGLPCAATSYGASSLSTNYSLDCDGTFRSNISAGNTISHSVGGTGFSGKATWADALPTTQTSCVNSFVQVTLYGQSPSTGAWSQLGSTVAVSGVWHTGPGVTPYCAIGVAATSAVSGSFHSIQANSVAADFSTGGYHNVSSYVFVSPDLC